VSVCDGLSAGSRGFFAGRARVDREGTHPDPVVLEDDDAAVVDVRFERRVAAIPDCPLADSRCPEMANMEGAAFADRRTDRLRPLPAVGSPPTAALAACCGTLCHPDIVGRWRLRPRNHSAARFGAHPAIACRFWSSWCDGRELFGSAR
jgi:hypothetical protein